MTPDQIMAELYRNDIFPRYAMQSARMQREAMTPIFIALMDHLASQPYEDISEEAITAGMPVFHLLGEWREPRAFEPTLALMRRPREETEMLLGDAVTETSFRVLAGTFNGNLNAIYDSIDDRKADDFARGSMLIALVLIGQMRPELQDDINAYFREFLPRHPDASAELLIGWIDCVADLGLADMEKAALTLFQLGRIPKDDYDLIDFTNRLHETLANGGRPKNPRYKTTVINDAISELSSWYGYSDAFFAERAQQKTKRGLQRAPWDAMTKALFQQMKLN